MRLVKFVKHAARVVSPTRSTPRRTEVQNHLVSGIKKRIEVVLLTAQIGGGEIGRNRPVGQLGPTHLRQESEQEGGKDVFHAGIGVSAKQLSSTVQDTAASGWAQKNPRSPKATRIRNVKSSRIYCLVMRMVVVSPPAFKFTR